ncbi:MAG: SPOR domain-containing protein [Ignavibacteriales bacterium]|nr:MAG: SPOR domain-containing protein [Ignavibacteriales bacterium]
MDRFTFINKLANLSGVSLSESRRFAEIFIRKVYDLIQPGDGIKLAGLGTAYYARYKFQPIQNENDPDTTDIIVFTDEANEILTSSENSVFFTVPSTDEPKQNALDKFFSLSISKPVINGSVPGENNISVPAGEEIESLLNSKAEKLITGYEVIKNVVDPALTFPLSGTIEVKNKVEALDTTLDDELDSLLLSDIKDEELLKELEKISWDLDDESLDGMTADDVAKEHEKEILEIEPTPEQPETVPEIENDIPESSEEPGEESLPTEIDETNEEELPDDIMEGSIQAEIKSEFEQVKSYRGELTIEDKNLDSEVDPFQAAIDRVNREIETDENVSEVINDDNQLSKAESEFVEVVPKSSLYDSNIINVVENDDEEFPDEPEEENEKEAEDIDPDKYHRDALKEAKNFVSERRNIGLKKEKRNSTLSLLIIIIVLLLITASIFIYLKYIKSPERTLHGANGGGNIAKISLVEVIERNYELPVTYPYPESRRNSLAFFDGLDSSIIKSSMILGNNRSDSMIVSSEDSIKIPERSLTKSPVVRIKNNIYKYDINFVVQVASFKSKIIAEGEALKYNRQGRQSYIEEVEIPGRGTWFRLRIGNFASLGEAETFMSKSK